jgi:hypothetical protein
MGCQSVREQQTRTSSKSTYPAPQSPTALLAAVPLHLQKRPVYSYIVTTIKTYGPDYSLRQTGSAPNFAGGRITLCTCKHKDRATFCPSTDRHDPWKNVCVAGLTSKTSDPSRSLAYLMCVERSFPHQWELWHALSPQCRYAKSASQSELGDLYEPKASMSNDPYDPSNYYRPPIGKHVHSTKESPDTWRQDIMLWSKRRVPHRLLLGSADYSYRWTTVRMILKLNAIGVSAHHAMYDSLREFVDDLQGFDP